MPETTRLLITCEHGGNQIPAEYRSLFAGQEELLESHRGYDIGVLPFARRLARELDAPLEAAEVTRLLVDLNRSLHSRTLFSEFTRDLPAAAREGLLQRYYHPFREVVAARVAAWVAAGERVAHISVHSFTPALRGRVRRADIGLLYDPAHPGERALCRRWQEELAAGAPQWRVRRNYPYRGISDSVATALRRRYPAASYLGMELEINQKHPAGPAGPWQQLQKDLIATLKKVYINEQNLDIRPVCGMK